MDRTEGIATLEEALVEVVELDEVEVDVEGGELVDEVEVIMLDGDDVVVATMELEEEIEEEETTEELDDVVDVEVLEGREAK